VVWQNRNRDTGTFRLQITACTLTVVVVCFNKVQCCLTSKSFFMEFKLAFRLKKEQLKSRLGVIKLNELLNILMNS